MATKNASERVTEKSTGAARDHRDAIGSEKNAVADTQLNGMRQYSLIKYHIRVGDSSQ